MSERYTRVFSLPENLYTIGSPVVISAGALLKDNQTGKILAQLKLTNIQYKRIKAVKVKLFPQDTMGQPLGKAIDYQYLDLQLTRDGDFGAKTPIPFTDPTARAFAVEVTAVVFSDNTAWNSDASPWEPIPDSIPLHRQYDNLVIEQLRLEQSGTCQFVVQEHKGLWLCTCGAVNHDGEARCHDCGKQLSQIHPLDVEGLTERAKQRLAEEARQSAKEKAEREVALAVTKKKTAKILKFSIPVICAVIAIALLFTKVIIPNGKYNDAVALMNAGKYSEAIAAFDAMDGYKDSAAQIKYCEDAIAAAEQARAEEEKAAEEARIETEKAAAYTEAEMLANNGETAKAAIAFGKLGEYKDAREQSLLLWNDVPNLETISTRLLHTVALCSDGSVVATGANDDGRCNVSDWRDIVAVCAGDKHTVGLKTDGTVVAVGQTENGQCEVSQWKEIVAISAGDVYSVGLRADGTAVAVGYNKYGQCNVNGWSDITAISASYNHTVGLRKDGSVAVTGASEYNFGQCDVNKWADMKAISAGAYHTVGLSSNGMVVTTGGNRKDLNYGQCDVTGWSDIVAVSAGWHQTIGVRANGTVVAIGDNADGQCNVSSWKNIKLPN